MPDFNIRNAYAEDLAQIVAIYNAAIPGRLATGDLESVSVESREPWFKAHRPEKYPLIVAEDEGGVELMGWASLGAFYGRVAYRHTAEISVYIDASHMRKGVGNALIEELVHRCPKLDIKSLMAFIFGHNHPSKKLFENRGFALWGTLPKIADLDGIERDLEIYGMRITEPVALY